MSRGLTFCLNCSCLLLLAAPNQGEEAPAETCEEKAEYRQLDFWVGEWVVTSKGEKVGESRVEKLLRGCAVVENWTAVRGASGKSLNFYNPETKKWQQHWVSDRGQISEFLGELKDGALRLEGYSVLPDGSRLRRRMTLLPLPIGVRQVSEYSDDNGKTWKVAYDFLYTQKR